MTFFFFLGFGFGGSSSHSHVSCDTVLSASNSASSQALCWQIKRQQYLNNTTSAVMCSPSCKDTCRLDKISIPIKWCIFWTDHCSSTNTSVEFVGFYVPLNSQLVTANKKVPAYTNLHDKHHCTTSCTLWPRMLVKSWQYRLKHKAYVIVQMHCNKDL